ncbi:MAG: glycosyltransferase [Gammaproteobacteria bacterium]
MRKKILILGHNAATQFIDIFNQYTHLFDKDKYEVTVAYLMGAPDNTVRQRTIAEHILFLDLPKRSLRYLKIRAIRKLLSLCKREEYEMVICHRYKPSYIMLWVAQFCQIPALFFVMHEMRTMKAFGRRLLIAALARKNMIFAGVSNAVRDDLRQRLWLVPKNRIVTLYNMIDIEHSLPALLPRKEAREALNLPDNAFVFGNLARLAPNKDHENLIHSFSMIKPYCPQAKLIILGEGSLEAKLKEQVHHYGLTHDIIFAGFVPQASHYMNAFDCFVLTSVQEAFGRVLLEAMIAKLPIIATEVNGIPEVMRDTGKLIKPRDPIALITSMTQIYETSKRDRDAIGEKAWQHVNKNYSIPAFKKQFWSLPLVKKLKE